MSVVVNFLEAGLMHMRMGVLGPVIVGVRVLVLDMLVLMGGVRVCVSQLAVPMFVRMRHVVGVLLCHGHRLLHLKYVVLAGDSLIRCRSLGAYPAVAMARQLPGAHRRRGDGAELRDRRARR